jgi:hypothetical protein
MIIFAEDFRQLEPIGVNETELLFSSLSSQHWENCINAVIILDNDLQFKEDPKYGQMLKRMWSGDLSKEDCKRINTRVIGYNGLELPTEFEGEQKIKTFENQINCFTLTSILLSRGLLLCLSNKQRTQCYPSSNLSTTYTSNTPNVNLQ